MARTKQTERDQELWQIAMKEAIERLEQEKRQRARASKTKKVAHHGDKKKAKHKRNQHDDVKVAPKKDKEHCETAEKSD